MNTHTQTEPSETMITINHRRPLLILRGFCGSLSSHPTVYPVSSSGPVSTSTSLPAILVPSFNDQLRSIDLIDLDAERCCCNAPPSRVPEFVIGAKVTSSDFDRSKSLSLCDSAMDIFSSGWGLCIMLGEDVSEWSSFHVSMDVLALRLF